MARALGFSLSVDDFGVEYSNINRLIESPFNRVKFDKLFLKDIKHKLSRDLLYKIHDVVSSNGMETVIEGVEDRAAYVNAMRIGANFYQGWYFGKGFSLEKLLSTPPKKTFKTL